MTILLDLHQVSLQGADRTVLDELSLTVSTDDRIGVVGINGTGKSALLKLIAGVLEPDAGSIRRGRSTRVHYLEQSPQLPPGTVRDALGRGWRADASLDQLGILDLSDTETSQLSGGQLKRAALARVFCEPCDVLVLDEPTNHLDLNAIQWLEHRIRTFEGAVVLVSHDRFLLDQVSTRMVEIDRGAAFIHAGGYSRYLEAQARREELAASAEKTRRNLARSELAWLRRGVKARSTKPQARIDAAKRLLAERPAAAARAGKLDLRAQTPRLGTSVIKAHRVAFSYDGRHDVLRDVNLELGPGDRVGVVGRNGTGKTTLLNLLDHQLTPSAGTVKHGPTVVMSHLAQDGGSFDEGLTVQELVAGPDGVPGSPADLTLMKRFWFTGTLPLTRARHLSGGERRRLQLLLSLSARPNVLLLDEPTNDLDLETIRLLEEFLGEWPGTLVVVSHDRAFLSRTTDRLLEVHEDATISDVAGGIDAWIARALGTTTEQPGATGKPSARVAPAPSIVARGRQLRDAEKEMTRLERRRKAITDQLLATQDHARQAGLGAELASVQKALNDAEDHWLGFFED